MTSARSKSSQVMSQHCSLRKFLRQHRRKNGAHGKIKTSTTTGRMFCGNSPASQGARRETSARTRTQIILRGQRHDRFRPKETQEGDLICQFKNSDVIAIVRAENFRYRIIGRCVEFLAGGGRPQPFRWGAEDPDNSGFGVPTYPIDFWMDIQTLQLLTKVEAGGEPEPKSLALTATHKAKSW